MKLDEFVEKYADEIDALDKWIGQRNGLFFIYYQTPGIGMRGDRVPVCRDPRDALDNRYELRLRKTLVPFSDTAWKYAQEYNERVTKRESDTLDETAWFLAEKWDKLEAVNSAQLDLWDAIFLNSLGDGKS